ncbi:HAD-IA family hydrolase [Paenibacillus koleovorans]|uniref:HAD-IA family hydrolase n=1 Tax=Paenibacillus koleovorans TaxID=121608 RepID=UPI000FD7928C|nr:HAD-IA family hydrolase [Paenibacillus koleovorans]
MILHPTSPYKAVFFDAGDTLLTVPGARETMRRYFAEREFHRTDTEIGDSFDAAFRLLYYNKPVLGNELCSPESDRLFWVKLYRHMLDDLAAAGHAEEETLHRWCHELYDLFVSPEQYVLFEDVRETLERLQALGYRMAIVSNFAPTLRHILKYMEIDYYFDPIIVSTEVGLEKPNPAIFQLALEQSGLPASQVLYVGDHDQNDIWAPGQVGIQAVKIKRYAYHQGDGIHSLRELLG